jgi:hypothetical protein
VRFDRPVDHRKSTLVIKQGDKVIERLTPRLESAPEVLFAEGADLAAGADYTLHWAVITLQGGENRFGRHPFPGLRPTAQIGTACGLAVQEPIQVTLRIRRPTRIVRKAIAVPSAASASRSSSTGGQGAPRLRLLMPMASGEKKRSATP